MWLYWYCHKQNVDIGRYQVHTARANQSVIVILDTKFGAFKTYEWSWSDNKFKQVDGLMDDKKAKPELPGQETIVKSNELETMSFSGMAESIIDGDTLKIRSDDDHGLYVIRLKGIDAPELDQPYGYKAKFYLTKLVSSELTQGSVPLMVICEKKERHDFYIGIVLLLDKKKLIDDGTELIDDENKLLETTVNYQMLKEGLAWCYNYDKPCSGVFNSTEQDAREKKIGLWADTSPIPPWKWKKEN